MSDPDRLSTHFCRSEFSCKCGCGCDTVDIGLLAVLETIRTHFGKPVVINSGMRCAAHNAEIRGKSHSKHLEGRAADIFVPEVPANEIQDFIESRFPDTLGMGRYALFTHIDTRTGPMARW